MEQNQDKREKMGKLDLESEAKVGLTPRDKTADRWSLNSAYSQIVLLSFICFGDLLQGR